MNLLKGWIGERITTFGLWISLDNSVYRRFHDVIVPTSNGTTQIDHLVVSPFGVFVVETKNLGGWIFGSEKEERWTQCLHGKKYSFQNPLRQNFRHTRCLAEHLNLDHAALHPVVFFVGECRFKTPVPSNVIRSGLGSHIKGYRQILLDDGEITRISNAVSALKGDRTLNRRTHMASLRERHGATTTCPKCGSQLVERTAGKGARKGNRFTGCSGYPRCRYTLG